MSKNKKKNSKKTHKRFNNFEDDFNYDDFVQKRDSMRKINLKPIHPKNDLQADILEKIDRYSINFLLGTTGYGKTYLACYKALQALNEQSVSRIILVRPNVGSGYDNELGFLKGDANEKMQPIIASLVQAIVKLIGGTRLSATQMVEQYIATGVIEVVPINFARGRNFDNCFVLFDEAQNARIEALKLILERIEDDSKVCIMGDIDQIDLPDPSLSCLHHVTDIFEPIANKGDGLISITTSTSYRDNVRGRLSRSIVKSFAKWQNKNEINTHILSL